MIENAQVHYLEIVTPHVDQMCDSYSKTLNVEFSDAVTELGGARLAELASGGNIGVRVPMHETEEPTTRPYYLVNDIENAINDAEASGAEILVGPMEIPHHGKCAIIRFGNIQSGFWQR